MDETSETSAYKRSKDADFHAGLCQIRQDIRDVVHCHSPWATEYASAGIEIPCLTVQTIGKINFPEP
ncbi:MAG: class II aldolase/adducin family protein [Pseudoprimorskyibacter sp.]|nr:class II aldolase/adducin family protein [Pseudoprimorskyibacter sp.]